METKEYVDFMAAQEKNFLETFGEPLHKGEFLYAARRVYAKQIEAWMSNQLFHLKGARLAGFIRELQGEIELEAIASETQMAEFLDGLKEGEQGNGEERKTSSKRNSRSTRPGKQPRLVVARGNERGEQSEPPRD